MLNDSQLARLISGSAHQVWLAGIGAYARAQHEGSRLFENLADLGDRIDQQARDRVNGVRSSANDTWDRLESAFVDRVARALNALQIPTARDVHELNRRVEALSRAVERLERAAVAAAASKPRRAAKKKARAATRTPRRKPSTPRRKAAARG
jgi:poly(hydroxyalkanoate) granule-associated protein